MDNTPKNIRQDIPVPEQELYEACCWYLPYPMDEYDSFTDWLRLATTHYGTTEERETLRTFLHHILNANYSTDELAALWPREGMVWTFDGEMIQTVFSFMYLALDGKIEDIPPFPTVPNEAEEWFKSIKMKSDK
jgi:hypothetical protein